jgi:hypothetical protein
LVLFLTLYIGEFIMVSKLNVVPAVELFDAVIASQSELISSVASNVAELYRADSELESLGVRVADKLNEVLQSQGELSLGWYDAVRLSFGDAYKVVKVGSSDEAVRKAWSRAFKLVTDYYNIEKPKAESSGAEKKAAQREKQAELLAAYESLDVVELKDKAKSLYNKAGDGDKQAKKEADLIVKAIDARSKAEQAERKDLLKDIKTKISATLKQVYDLDVLADVLVMLEGSVEDSDI